MLVICISERFCVKSVPEKFAIFKEKHLCWSLFLITLQPFRPETLLERNFNTSFPMNIEEFLKATILKNICERLFLVKFLFFRELKELSRPQKHLVINLFQPNIQFLYPLRTSQNLRAWLLRRNRNGTLN